MIDSAYPRASVRLNGCDVELMLSSVSVVLLHSGRLDKYVAEDFDTLRAERFGTNAINLMTEVWVAAYKLRAWFCTYIYEITRPRALDGGADNN